MNSMLFSGFCKFFSSKRAQAVVFDSVFYNIFRLLLDLEDKLSGVNSKQTKYETYESKYEEHYTPPPKRPDVKVPEPPKPESKSPVDTLKDTKYNKPPQKEIKDEPNIISREDFYRSKEADAIIKNRNNISENKPGFKDQVKSMYNAIKTLPRNLVDRSIVGTGLAHLENYKTIRKLRKTGKPLYIMLPGEKMPRGTTRALGKEAKRDGYLPYHAHVNYSSLEHLDNDIKYEMAAKDLSRQVDRIYRRGKIKDPSSRKIKKFVKPFNHSDQGFNVNYGKDMLAGHSSGARTAQTYATMDDINNTGIGSVMAVAGDMHEMGYGRKKNTMAQKLMGAVFPINKYNVDRSYRARKSAMNSLGKGAPKVPVHAVHGRDDMLVRPKDTATPYNTTNYVIDKNHFETSFNDPKTSAALFKHHKKMHHELHKNYHPNESSQVPFDYKTVYNLK